MRRSDGTWRFQKTSPCRPQGALSIRNRMYLTEFSGWRKSISTRSTYGFSGSVRKHRDLLAFARRGSKRTGEAQSGMSNQHLSWDPEQGTPILTDRLIGWPRLADCLSMRPEEGMSRCANTGLNRPLIFPKPIRARDDLSKRTPDLLCQHWCPMHEQAMLQFVVDFFDLSRSW